VPASSVREKGPRFVVAGSAAVAVLDDLHRKIDTELPPTGGAADPRDDPGLLVAPGRKAVELVQLVLIDLWRRRR